MNKIDNNKTNEDSYIKLISFPFMIILGVLVVCIILGSLFDYKIDKAIFMDRQWFCIFLSVIGMAPSYYGLVFISGVLISDTIKRPYNMLAKVVLIGFACAMALCGIYFQGDEIASKSGFDFEHSIYGLVISMICGGVFIFFGILVGKRNERRDLYKIIIAMGVIVLVGQVLGVQLFKMIMHRPRYRAIASGGLDETLYHNWYRRFGDYKDYITDVVTKDEFKSFPSGHAASSFMAIMFLIYLPYFFPELKEKKKVLFYIGIAWFGVISISRLIVGAHYLTDIAFGGLIALVFFYIGNYILEKKVLKI